VKDEDRPLGDVSAGSGVTKKKSFSSPFSCDRNLDRISRHDLFMFILLSTITRLQVYLDYLALISRPLFDLQRV